MKSIEESKSGFRKKPRLSKKGYKRKPEMGKSLG